jgi:gliding motility-associated lipoprotein GldH
MKYFVIVIFLLFAMMSCKHGVIYEDEHTIPNASWHQDSTIDCKITITDTLTPVNVLYEITNNNDYPFSNLYLFTWVKFPNGKLIQDTLEMVLASSSGKWIGKGWFGSHKTTFPFRMNIRFPYIGMYHFKVTQAMRCPGKMLNGVTSFGLKIKRR